MIIKYYLLTYLMFLKHEYVRPLGSLLIGIPAAVKEPAVASLTA